MSTTGMKNRTKKHSENTNRLDIQRKIFVIIITTCQQICEQKSVNEKIKFFCKSFMTVSLSYRNQSICKAYQWTGFYMIETSVMKEL